MRCIRCKLEIPFERIAPYKNGRGFLDWLEDFIDGKNAMKSLSVTFPEGYKAF